MLEYNEADTRAKLIDPKLHEAGWKEDYISREYPIRTVKSWNEDKQGLLYADYILIYKNTILAVIEAKENSSTYNEAVDQAKRYASRLNVRFTFAQTA